MKFEEFVSKLSVFDVLCDWWRSLSCEHFRRNIEGEQLFEADVTLGNEGRVHLQSLGVALPNSLGQTSEEKLERIVREKGILIGIGPTIDCHEALCQVFSLRSLTTERKAESRVVPPFFPTNEHPTLTADLAEYYYQMVKERPAAWRDYAAKWGHEFDKDPLSILFWAVKRDVDGLLQRGPCDVVRLLQFLGVEATSKGSPAGGAPAPRRAFLVGIKPRKTRDVVHVPTCFDAYRHRHFRNAKPGDRYGRTKDVVTGDEGARECVSAPVLAANTHFERAL